MAVLEVKDLTKVYRGGKRKKDFVAVDHISFSLEKGEIVGFLGPNGAGKTTTIQMLLGTLTPTSGEICYFGKEFWKSFDSPSFRSGFAQDDSPLRRIGFASAYSDLPWRMTVWENLSFYAEIYEVKNKKDRIKNLLKEFGAEEFLNKSMNSLSAGQKTRILLTKAFLNQPEIVLLDEPTASLDVEVAVDVRNYIRKMQKEFGTAVLLTSHNMKDVEELANRVIVINHGSLVDEGTPIELMRKMANTKLRFQVFEKADLAQIIMEDFGFSQIKKENGLTEIVIQDELIPKFLAKMFEKKVFIRDLEIDRPGLEEYFLHKTNKRE